MSKDPTCQPPAVQIFPIYGIMYRATYDSHSPESLKCVLEDFCFGAFGMSFLVTKFCICKEFNT